MVFLSSLTFLWIFPFHRDITSFYFIPQAISIVLIFVACFRNLILKITQMSRSKKKKKMLSPDKVNNDFVYQIITWREYILFTETNTTICSFLGTFSPDRSIVWSLVRSFVRSLVRELVSSLPRSFDRLPVRFFFHPFLLSLVRLLVRSLIRSFTHSFVCYFVRSYVVVFTFIDLLQLNVCCLISSLFLVERTLRRVQIICPITHLNGFSDLQSTLGGTNFAFNRGINNTWFEWTI